MSETTPSAPSAQPLRRVDLGNPNLGTAVLGPTDPADLSAIDDALAELDHLCAAERKSTLIEAAPDTADDDLETLPPRWRERHKALLDSPRGVGKAPICYTLAGWLIEDWKREHRKEPSLAEIAATIGISRSQAQKLRDQVRKLLARGGLWKPTVSGKKRAAVSGKRVKKSINPEAQARRASSDFCQSFWRSGGVEAIDLASTSVVDHHAHYIDIGRKLPPVHLLPSRSKQPLEAPPDDFSDLRPLDQVVIAYGALVRKWEGITYDGLDGAAYRLTGKMHARTEAVVRSKSDPAPYVRKRCLQEIEKERVRRGAPKFPFDLMIILERDKRGQWHVHGAVGGPVLYKEIIKAGIDRALGRWRHDGPSQRGFEPVLLERGVTTRGITYGANKPACYVADDAQVAITRGLVREAKRFYRECVKRVLAYRRGEKLDAHNEAMLMPAGSVHTDCLRRSQPLIWRGLETAARSRGKTLSRRAISSRPLGITAAAITGDMAAAITAERAALH